MRSAIRQMSRDTTPPVVTLYFHPWDLDPEQARLPLRRLSRLRTYVGMSRSRARLLTLLGEYSFTRAIDVVKELDISRAKLPCFRVSSGTGKDLALPEAWLRLERREGKLQASVSDDGEEWTPVKLTAPDFGKKVKVGIGMVNVTTKEFLAHFEDYSVLQKKTER